MRNCTDFVWNNPSPHISQGVRRTPPKNKTTAKLYCGYPSNYHIICAEDQHRRTFSVILRSEKQNLLQVVFRHQVFKSVIPCGGTHKLLQVVFRHHQVVKSVIPCGGTHKLLQVVLRHQQVVKSVIPCGGTHKLL